MKLFTIEEAKSLLPTVRAIIRSIQRSHRRLVHFQTAARRAAEGAEFDGGCIPQRARNDPLLFELAMVTSKLESLGIQHQHLTQRVIQFSISNRPPNSSAAIFSR